MTNLLFFTKSANASERKIRMSSLQTKKAKRHLLKKTKKPKAKLRLLKTNRNQFLYPKKNHSLFYRSQSNM